MKNKGAYIVRAGLTGRESDNYNMQYIMDLTIIMRRLFKAGPSSEFIISVVVNDFATSIEHAQVHNDIRNFPSSNLKNLPYR